MNAEPRTLRTEAEQGLLTAYEEAAGRLPGGEAVRARRESAIAEFRRAGLPHRRIEAWKYTDLRALMRRAAPLALDSGAVVSASAGTGLEELDRARLVIANGAFRPDLSDIGGLGGVEIRPLAEVLFERPDLVGALFKDADDPVLALNSALMTDGVVIAVAAGASIARPIEICHLAASGAPESAFVRNVVTVGAGAHVRVVESHRGPDGSAYQRNAVTELSLDEGARVVWAKLQLDGDAAFHLGSMVVRLADRAELDHLTLTTGAAVARSQSFVAVAGEKARAGFYGATMIAGRQHADVTLTLDHSEPCSTSKVLFKNVADGAATGAFQGQIVVRREAQQTDARMMTRSLLLSEDASFAAKPELEIYADNVQCGHGATSGRIDEDMLFYFLARGIPRAEAEKLLVIAFLSEAVEALPDPDMVAAIEPVIEQWLSERAATLRRSEP